MVGRIVVVATIVTLGLAGCAPPAPTPEQLAATDYGPYPHDYEEIIDDHMRGILVDPRSAQYDWVKKPTRGWIRSGPRGGDYFGYMVCVWINAKNGLGGYTGRELYFFMINDGKIVKSACGEGGVISQDQVEEWCGSS